MKRLDDWPNQLQAAINRFDGVPWVWGETDCWQFAAAAIAAVTGADFIGTYAGQYRSRLSALARVRGRGHRSFTDAAVAELARIGAEQVPPQFARVGDIGITICETMCVRTAAGFIARGADGRMYVAANIQSAWRIGD